MKRAFLAVTTALFFLTASAQDLVRYNYKKGDKIYTGTERLIANPSYSKEDAVMSKLSRVIFSDGEPVWILRLDFMEPTSWKMPKNAPLSITTTEGRAVLLQNYGVEPNLVAPEGMSTEKGLKYLNYGEYYMDNADIQKIVSGVATLDATKRWTDDGHIIINYKNNELGEVIAAQYNAIMNSEAPTTALGDNLKSIQDNRGSRLTETNLIKVADKLSISLVYLYYAPNSSESIDLNLYVPGQTVPYAAAIDVYLKNGKTINLHQEKELSGGRALTYPTPDQVKEMMDGVIKVTIQTKNDTETITFPNNEFSDAIYQLYNSLMMVSIL